LTSKNEKEENLLKEKELLLRNVSSFKLDTVQKRVAWLLNNYPGTRDSDITLQIKYWEHFESNICNGQFVNITDLYKLTRLTTITRARAKIQNTYKLFLAIETVRAHRGKLAKEEKDNAISNNLFPQTYSVYADESGKTDKILIVGSVWFLNSFETFAMTKDILKFGADNGFKGEIHFQFIDKSNIDKYMKFADFLYKHN
jgi:hypothetical protein